MWTIHTSGECTLATKRTSEKKALVEEKGLEKKAFTITEAYQMIWDSQDDEGSNGGDAGLDDE